MNESDILNLGTHAITVMGELAAPLLAVSLIVGIVISLVQTIFSLQDQTLSMVPRLVLCGLVLILAGPWMLHTIVDFTTQVYDSIPNFIRGS